MQLVFIEGTELTGGRASWRLDFNDIGTEVAENLSTQ
jgi:hypothetical protein